MRRSCGRWARSKARPHATHPSRCLIGPTALRERLRNRLGRELFGAWLRELECERIDGAELIVSVPTPFTERWIDQNFPEELRECAAIEFPGSFR